MAVKGLLSANTSLLDRSAKSRWCFRYRPCKRTLFGVSRETASLRAVIRRVRSNPRILFKTPCEIYTGSRRLEVSTGCCFARRSVVAVMRMASKLGMSRVLLMLACIGLEIGKCPRYQTTLSAMETPKDQCRNGNMRLKSRRSHATCAADALRSDLHFHHAACEKDRESSISTTKNNI